MFFLETLEAVEKLEIFDDYIKMAEHDKNNILLTLILKSTVDKKDLEFFTKTLNALISVGFIQNETGLLQEEPTVFYNNEKYLQKSSNELHNTVIYLLNETNYHYIVCPEHLQMLNLLLQEQGVDFTFRIDLLENINSYDLNVQYLLLDTHALNHWNELGLNTIDLDKQATRQLRKTLQYLIFTHSPDIYNLQFKYISGPNIVRYCTLIENTSSFATNSIISNELIKKESRKQLLSKLKEYPHNKISKETRNSLIKVIATRLFIRGEC